MQDADESEIEWNLELVRRLVPNVDGRDRWITANRCVWNLVDAAAAKHGVHAGWLVELAERESRDTRFPFDIAFPHVASHMLVRGPREE